MTGRRVHPVATAGAVVAFLLLLAPLATVALYSLNSAKGLAFEGFSLKWYRELFEDPAIGEAAGNTLLLGLYSTLVSTVLGTMLAIALARYPWPRRTARAVDVVVDLPVVTPDIVFAAALVVAFAILRGLSGVFDPGLPAMVIGHVTFEVSFVALVVRSRLAVLGRSLSEAAHDLNATPFTSFRRVTLPLVRPAIVTGAVLAFTLSIDDFVISFFTYGPRSITLPILIYSSVRRGLSPKLHALSTIIILVTIVLVVALSRRTGTEREAA